MIVITTKSSTSVNPPAARRSDVAFMFHLPFVSARALRPAQGDSTPNHPNISIQRCGGKVRGVGIGLPILLGHLVIPGAAKNLYRRDSSMRQMTVCQDFLPHPAVEGRLQGPGIGSEIINPVTPDPPAAD